MPRKKSPPRLWPERRPGRETIWHILDGGRKISTGIPERDAAAAERALASYIAQKHAPSGERRPSSLSVAEVLAYYLRERIPHLANQADPKRHIRFLAEFWKGKTVAQIKGQSCRDYVTWRCKRAARGDGISTARHDLETLSAAINFYHDEYTLDAVPTVSLPDPAPRREEWVSRDEVAALLRAVRGRPRARHVARFI